MQLSSAGHGTFSYIPDSSMIGTVFCNFIANALCVVHSVIDVQVELSVRSWLTCLSNPFLTPLPLFRCSRVPNSTR